MKTTQPRLDTRLIDAANKIMERAALAAGESLIHDFGEVEQLQVSRKGPADFASKADHRAEMIVVDHVTKAYPDFGVITEESGVLSHSDDATWIIDPLDGTFNFLHGVPHFCVSIGLEVGGNVVAGVIYDPVKRELFSSTLDVAKMNNHRLRVSSSRDASEALVAYGIATHLRKTDDSMAINDHIKRTYGYPPITRRTGSTALDLAYVASGRFDGFWSLGMKTWDVAAGLSLILAAGGYSAINNKLNYSVYDIDSGFLCTGNETIFKVLMKACQESSTKESSTVSSQSKDHPRNT